MCYNNFERHKIIFLGVISVFGILIFDLLMKAPVLFSSAEFLDDIELSARYLNAPDTSSNLGLRTFSRLVFWFKDMNHVQLFLEIMLAFGITMYVAVFFIITRAVWPSVCLAMLIVTFPQNYIISIFANGSYNSQFIFWFGAGLLFAALAIKGDSLSVRKRCYALLVSKALLAISLSVTISGILVPLFTTLIITVILWAVKAPKALRVTSLISDLAIPAAFIFYFSNYQHPYTKMEGRFVSTLSELLLNSNRITTALMTAYWDPVHSTGKSLSRYSSLPGLFLNLSIGLVLFVRLFFIKRPPGARKVLYAASFCFTAYIFSVAPLAMSRITHIWHFQLPSLFLLSAIFLTCMMMFSKRVALIVAGAVSVLGILSMSTYSDVYALDAKNQIYLGNFLVTSYPEISDSTSLIVYERKHFPVSGLHVPSRFNGLMKDYIDESRRVDIHLVRTSNIDRIEHGLANPETRWYVWADNGIELSGREQIMGILLK